MLRGLLIYDRFSVADATMIYWGIGRPMGDLVPQNRRGDLIGQIRDLGRRGPYERAYATNEDLGFHTDSTDYVGLMCLRPALYGGESFVASSGLLYNFVVSERLGRAAGAGDGARCTPAGQRADVDVPDGILSPVRRVPRRVPSRPHRTARS